MTYRSVLQIFPLLRYSATWQPTPSGEPAPGRVKEPEVVAIADTRNSAQEASFAKECGLDITGSWDATKVGTIESDQHKGRGSQEQRGDDGPGIGVV